MNKGMREAVNFFLFCVGLLLASAFLTIFR